MSQVTLQKTFKVVKSPMGEFNFKAPFPEEFATTH